MERIKAHREAIKPRSIAVPEWGEEGKPLVVFAKPETLEDFGAIAAANEKGLDHIVFETLRRLAVDEEGKPLFKGVIFTDFKWHAYGPVAVRIATFLREPVTVADAEGNSEASLD